MLSVTEVARRLNCSAGCVYQLVARGEMPHVRIGIGRGVIRVRESDLERFISRNLHGRLRNVGDPPRHDLKKLVG